MSTYRKIIATGLVLIIGIFTGTLILNYINSFQSLTINYINIQSVTLYDNKDISNIKLVKDVKESGQPLRLKKGSYLIRYKGKEGYQSLFENIVLSDEKKVVSIDPQYTDEKLVSILDFEFDTIQTVLASKYPKINIYEPERGKLYKKGE